MPPPEAVPADLDDLVALSVELARAGAQVLRRHRRAPVQVTRTKSSRTDVVTAADLASEQELRRRLAAARPQDGVLGEEEGLVPGSSGLTWVVDPLDGTVNYLYGTGTYAVSVAVVRHGVDPLTWQVLAGAVVDVEPGTLYSAGLGAGAARDGEPVHASACDRLDECLLGTGFSYDSGDRDRQGRALARLLPQVRDVRRIGSAALDLCLVGAGRLDAYLESGLKPWDLAAGSLVAREAGAVLTGSDGAAPDGRLLLAAAPGVALALGEAVARSGYRDRPDTP